MALLLGSAVFVVVTLLSFLITYAVTGDSDSDSGDRGPAAGASGVTGTGGAAGDIGFVAAPTAAATAAGCTGVMHDAPRGVDHVDGTVEYEVSPPSSGPHSADPMPDLFRFYEPSSGAPAERAVHNLEHGFVVAWYDAELPDDQVEELRAVSRAQSDRYFAMPWARGSFPDDKHFVLTAWNRTQRCETVSETVVSEFVAAYADPSFEGVTWDSSTAPESGVGGGTVDFTPTGPVRD